MKSSFPSPVVTPLPGLLKLHLKWHFVPNFRRWEGVKRGDCWLSKHFTRRRQRRASRAGEETVMRNECWGCLAASGSKGNVTLWSHVHVAQTPPAGGVRVCTYDELQFRRQQQQPPSLALKRFCTESLKFEKRNV